MTTLHFTITAKAPLVFSERRPDNQFRPSAPFVSGSVLRGALAYQMKQDGAPDTDFAALFTAPNAPLFRHALPASRVLPATAQTCKVGSGFLPGGHGVFDGLLDRLCWESLDDQLPMPFAYLPHCRKCPGRMEAFSGFYRQEGNVQSLVTPPRLLTTRVGINRSRRVAEEGLLYSPLVIREAEQDKGADTFSPTTFQGSVVVQDAAQEEQVRRYLGELTHVGSGASRGFGHIQVTFPAVPSALAGDVPTRVMAFNKMLQQRRLLWQQTVPDRLKREVDTQDTYFAVLLLSEAALRPDGWTPSVRLEPSLLGPELAHVSLVRCYAFSETRGGWNTAWGLPKDTETVAARGSVYVYRTAGSGDANVFAALTALEETGVGDRRQEGFGQVRICDEFHQQIQGGQA